MQSITWANLQNKRVCDATRGVVAEFLSSCNKKEEKPFLSFLDKLAEIPAFPWHFTEAVAMLFAKWRALQPLTTSSAMNSVITAVGKNKAWKCQVHTSLGELLVLIFHELRAVPQTAKAWQQIFAHLPTEDIQLTWEYLQLVKGISYALDSVQDYVYVLGTAKHYTARVFHRNLVYVEKHLQAFLRIGITCEQLDTFLATYQDEELDWFLRNFLSVFGFLPTQQKAVGDFWDKCMYLIGIKSYIKNSLYAYTFGLVRATEMPIAQTWEISDMLAFVGKFPEDVRLILAQIWVRNYWNMNHVFTNNMNIYSSLACEWWKTLEQKEALTQDLRVIASKDHEDSVLCELGRAMKLKYFGILPAYRAASHEEAMVQNCNAYFFAKYSLSPVIINFFFNINSEIGAHEYAFFKHLLEGNNPSTFSIDGFFILNKKEAHYFLQITHAYTCLKELVFEAKMLAKGITESAWIASLQGVIRNFELTERGSVFADMFLSWVATYSHASHEVFRQNLREVCDFLLHTWQEQRDSFTMKGRTPASLLRQSEEWHQIFRRVSHYAYSEKLVWLRGNTDNSTLLYDKVFYKFEELLSSDLLHAESNALGHCVRGYDRSCYNGSCRIWAVRMVYEEMTLPLLTIELRGHVIHQVKGKYNRTPDKREAGVVRIWAGKAGYVFKTTDINGY